MAMVTEASTASDFTSHSALQPRHEVISLEAKRLAGKIWGHTQKQGKRRTTPTTVVVKVMMELSTIEWHLLLVAQVKLFL